MSEVKIFQNDEFGTVRTLTINGEPWFVGKDVAEILGYKDTSDALKKHVDKDDKLSRRFTDSGQGREMYIINESGLYDLVLSSKLPNARKFKRWVTSEVLPSIRRHGMYATEELIANPDLAIAAFTALKAEREANKRLTAEVEEMKPKANYCDVVLSCNDLLKVTTIAKDYGQSARWLNNKLRELGVQFRQGELWVLYQQYAEKGYACTKTSTYINNDGTTHSKCHTYWTQKGRLFIYDLLKAQGILPIMERA